MSRILFELGFEEMPVQSLGILRQNADDGIRKMLSDAGLADAECSVCATPRRLVIMLDKVPQKTEESVIEQKGPPESIFYKEGSITKQGEGFIKSKGINEDDISVRNGFIWYEAKTGGVLISTMLGDTVLSILKNTEFPKRMRWNDSGNNFPRPVRWIVFLEDNKVIDFEYAGIKADEYTCANRNSGNKRIKAEHGFADLMRRHYVIIDSKEREDMIKEQGDRLAGEKGIEILWDNELLNEVCGLSEYPVCAMGTFNDKFTNMPPDIIIAALKQHQRYFSTMKDGKLSNLFLLVSNSPEGDIVNIVRNNEKVLTARLEDAEFYYNEDIKRTTAQYRNMLASITFFEGLGSILDKIGRNADNAQFIDSMLENRKMNYEEISMICKFDLGSDMIRDGKEFTKLQGIIGSHYAGKIGFNAEYAHVSREHYMPRTANDEMPSTYEGMIFSIADKADNIAGAFIAGYKPTSSKDPMSVRRDTLALLTLILKKRLFIDIDDIMRHALKVYSQEDKLEEVSEYMRTRFENVLSEQNISADIVRSLTGGGFNPVIISDKAHVISALKNTENFRNMAAGQKRAVNILQSMNPKKASLENGNQYETGLLDASREVESGIGKLLSEGEYDEALKLLLGLREHIDRFFDNVMVMSDNNEEKERRLYLLSYVRNIFLKFADFSRITFD